MKLKKVPYVDPPQLNAIRHAKFRTQKVLFRAVPSRYLRNRDISNFRTMVQKFRFRQTTVQIVYVRERYISNFRTMAQSSGNSCGTKLWSRALWNQHGRSLSGCMRRPTRSWTRRKDAVALREVRLRDFIVWFLCRLGLPLEVAMDIADRAVPDGTAGAPIVL